MGERRGFSAAVRTPLRAVLVGMIVNAGCNDDCQPAYDRLRRPRFLLEILNTGHFAFANFCLSVLGAMYPDCAPGTLPQDEAHQLVIRFAVPFFGHYLGRDQRWMALLEAGSEPPGVVYAGEP